MACKNRLNLKVFIMKYVFREPSFPLFLETDFSLLVAKDIYDLEKKIKLSYFKTKSSYYVIDSKGEGWAYYNDTDAISPLTGKKRWFKKEVIDLYNSFIKSDENRFNGTSLSSKNFLRLFNEIIEFSEKKVFQN